MSAARLLCRTDLVAGRQNRQSAIRCAKAVPAGQNRKSLNIDNVGDPNDEQIIYTDLTPTRLKKELAEMQTPVSNDLIRQWMDEQRLRPRIIRG